MQLVWFRRDLRIEDNPALAHAMNNHETVIAMYVATPKTWQRHSMSQSQQNCLRQSLNELKKSLDKLNVPLIIHSTDYFSDVVTIFSELTETYNVDHVYYNREYEFDERSRDAMVCKLLSSKNIQVRSYDDQCLTAPNIVLNGQGKPYTVYTPYKNNVLNRLKHTNGYRNYYPTPKPQPNMPSILETDAFQPLPCTQDISWLVPGESGANKALKAFITKHIDDYHQQRNFPHMDTTSRLSSYLAIGAISTRICLEKLLEETPNYNLDEVLSSSGRETWLSELLWRDFYKMICYQFPRVSRGQPFKAHTKVLTWSNNETYLNAWKDGNTGVPIIDAAMRQLNITGWMHNRLRMIVAMYFTKNLWLDWRDGEAYFASKLVDWDFTANNGGWQWCASTGNDAAPYFRVFNPILQSERFDPDGDFIRAYCPELASLDNKSIHYPHERYKEQVDYPKPLVDLKTSRQAAIEAFKHINDGI